MFWSHLDTDVFPVHSHLTDLYWRILSDSSVHISKSYVLQYQRMLSATVRIPTFPEKKLHLIFGGSNLCLNGWNISTHTWTHWGQPSSNTAGTVSSFDISQQLSAAQTSMERPCSAAAAHWSMTVTQLSLTVSWLCFWPQLPWQRTVSAGCGCVHSGVAD